MKKKWDELSLEEQAEMMKAAVKNGIYDLYEIRDKYNEFAEGGEVANEIPMDYQPLVSNTYQPIVDALKTDNTGFNIDDYTYRVQKLHPEVTRDQVQSLYNTTPYIASDKVIGTQEGGFRPGDENGYGRRVTLYPNAYTNNTGVKVTPTNANESLGDTLAHETNHLYTDILLGGSNETEKDLLFDAYRPGFVVQDPRFNGDYSEERAINAQIRNRISRENGNVVGKELDKAIDNTPDDVLMNMLFDPNNGYINQSGRKHMQDKNGNWNRTDAVRKALKDVALNSYENLLDSNITALGGPIVEMAREYAKGGNTVGEFVDAIYQNNPREEYLGEPSHHYDFTQSEEWANAHGYHPDARGHRDDRVKKVSHPSHPSRGTWDRDKFILSDFGMETPNYTLFGLNDGGQDPQATLIYDNGVVLPEFTVTPDGNYIENTYDNIRLHYAKGGKIHIKPENRGKFTRLKERTGHSASWFKEHGTPAQKKMAVFELNARKWKHGLGGNLFDGTSQPTQKMQIGLDVRGWPNYSLEEIVAYGDENERRRKAIQDAYLNFVIESNDATAVANGRPQNQHLVDKAVRGAKANATWEKEHPNLTAWGNTFASVPFIVATAPALEAIAGTSAGQMITSGLSFVNNTAKAVPHASTLLPWTEALLATGSATHGIQEIQEGNFTPMTALEVSPLVPPTIGIGNNLYFPHLREHIYASKAPIGYDGMLPAAKRIAEGVLSGRRADIDNPFWFNNESAETLAKEFAFVPKNISETEKTQYIKDFGQRALRARADIWRMYNRLPQKYNTFVESERYPGTYTAPEDIKALKWVPFPDKNVDPGDFVNSVGGNVGLPEITNLGKGVPDVGYTSKEFGVTTLSDLWDLHPFSRPNDRLISRIQRGYKEAFNTIEAPEFKWLKPLDERLAKFEVGKLINTKPIMVKNDVPWTMDRKLITDANGNLNFRTSYTQGFHSDNIIPQSVIDWKAGKPVIENSDIQLNPDSYDFLRVKLTTKSRRE